MWLRRNASLDAILRRRSDCRQWPCWWPARGRRVVTCPSWHSLRTMPAPNCRGGHGAAPAVAVHPVLSRRMCGVSTIGATLSKRDRRSGQHLAQDGRADPPPSQGRSGCRGLGSEAGGGGHNGTFPAHDLAGPCVHRWRNVLIAEISKITPSSSMSQRVGTLPNNMPPNAAPSTEPQAIQMSRGLSALSTEKAPERL